MARSLEQYAELLPRLNAASDAIGHAIRARLRDDGLNHHTVQARVKDPASVKAKLDRLKADGNFKYERGLEQLDDLIGVRVIMFLEPDIADVATALKGQFSCREDDDKTSSQRRNGQIGYAGRHLVLEIPAENVPVGCHSFIGDRFEVQIRTVLQHAWAAFEHDIRYKGGSEANAEVDRAFTMASTLIELADAQFSAINDIVKRRQAESTADFAENPATELTGDILQDMLTRLLSEHPEEPGPAIRLAGGPACRQRCADRGRRRGALRRRRLVRRGQEDGLQVPGRPRPDRGRLPAEYLGQGLHFPHQIPGERPQTGVEADVPAGTHAGLSRPCGPAGWAAGRGSRPAPRARRRRLAGAGSSGAGGRYLICSAFRNASSVSSTVRSTVVSNELSAPPPLIASATAAMDTLSGASQRL